MEICEQPFPKGDPRVAVVGSAVREVYGTAGPRFVQWLLQHRDEWPEFREDFKGREESIAGQPKGRGNVARRQASYVALVAAALELATRAVGWEVSVEAAEGLLVRSVERMARANP